jgi:glycine/D-amino acid oxidase-like deaminating enzyme
MGLGNYDFVVIGGGVTGLWAALHLAERGLRVQLLEQANSLGGATAHSGAGIRYYDPDEKISTHVELSAELYKRVTPQSSFTLCRSIYALDQQGDLSIEALRRGYDVLYPKDLAKIYPGISWKASQCGVYDVRAGYMQPHVVCEQLKNACEKLGVSLEYGCKVELIREMTGSLAVQTNKGIAYSEQVVLAVGYWTPKILESIGVIGKFTNRAIVINYLSGGAFPEVPFLVEHDTGFHMRPTSEGGILFGVPQLSWNVCPDMLPKSTAENRDLAFRKLSEYVGFHPSGKHLKTVVSADSFYEIDEKHSSYFNEKLHVFAAGNSSSFKYVPSLTLRYVNNILGGNRDATGI